MQVGASGNSNINSLLAVSFGNDEVAAAARQFYLNRLSARASDNAGEASVSGTKSRTTESLKNSATSALSLGTLSDATAATAAAYPLQRAPLKLGDFGKPQVFLSASDHAEIFGSEEMQNDPLNDEQAQRRSRSSQMQQLYNLLGGGSAEDAAAQGNAPAFTVEYTPDGQLQDVPPSADFRPQILVSDNQYGSVLNDAQARASNASGGDISSRVASLYQAVFFASDAPDNNFYLVG